MKKQSVFTVELKESSLFTFKSDFYDSHCTFCAVFLSKSIDPPLETTVQNALIALESFEALKASQHRGKLVPTKYGKLLASLPLSLESAILVVKGGQLGLLRESAVLAALMDSSPFPIVYPFGHESQVKFAHLFLVLHVNTISSYRLSVLKCNIRHFWRSFTKERGLHMGSLRSFLMYLSY